ncbi:MAG: hypothetical protein AB2L22_13260 [Syntrophales bacterium]
MNRAATLGRLAARLKPDEMTVIKDSARNQCSKETDVVKTRNAQQMKLLIDREAQLYADLAQRGNLSQIMTYESLLRGYFTGFLFLITAIGEYVFASWTILPFGLGLLETSILAVTIVIVSLEAVNLYCTYLRKQFPSFENQIFLLMSCLGFVLVILIIFFAADIRQNLYQTSALLNSSSDLEDTARNADSFFKNSSGSFIWLMIALTAAITVVGGISYHDIKLRLLMALSFWRLHSGIRNVKQAQARIVESNAELETRLGRFDEDFNIAYMKEKLRLETQGNAGLIQAAVNDNNMGEKIGIALASPVLLIALAVILFFIFRGTARGETIIFLDMSKSSSASDYLGRETAFQKNLYGIETFLKTNLRPADKIRIMGITENSFSNPFFILEGAIAKDKGVFGEKVAKDKLNLVRSWKKLNLKETARMTDVLGAIHLASRLFRPQDTDKRLIIFSDMRQFTTGFDLETPGVVDVDTLVNKASLSGRISPLNSVRVWCLGVHSSGKTSAYWSSLEQFWKHYFHQAKAREPIVFSMERRVEGYE